MQEHCIFFWKRPKVSEDTLKEDQLTTSSVIPTLHFSPVTPQSSVSSDTTLGEVFQESQSQFSGDVGFYIGKKDLKDYTKAMLLERLRKVTKKFSVEAGKNFLLTYHNLSLHISNQLSMHRMTQKTKIGKVYFLS